MFTRKYSIVILLLGIVSLQSIQITKAAEPAPGITQSEYVTAIVQNIDQEIEDNAFGFVRHVQKIRMQITSGTETGKTFTMENGILNNREDMRLHEGQRIVVDRMTREDGSVMYVMRERYRLPALYYLVGLFVVLSIVFGGITGITSIIGLLVSVAILLWFIVPRIAAGSDPLIISIVGSYLIACTSLYLAHGFNKRTTIALFSTCLTLALAALAAVFSVQFAQLFGMGTEESLFLQTGQFAGVNLRGLLIGGFIIGALGVLDDITTAQTAAIDEISKANPALSFRELRTAGFSVGKEHIASLINTLALAYVGASLPLFLLFQEHSDLPTWMIVNSESIAEELVRTLVGSTALLLAVPIATWSAAYFLRNRTGKVLHSHHRGHHH